MYHEESDTPAVARTSYLNEELGMVIFHVLLVKAHSCFFSHTTSFYKQFFDYPGKIRILG